MQRILDVRIVKWPLKLAYVAGVWIVGYVLQSLLELVNVPGAASNIVGSALSLGGILLGARIFRGRNELVLTPPTVVADDGQATLSVVLGILASVGVLAAVGTIVGAAMGHSASERLLELLTIPGAVTNVLWYAVLAYLYLNSASRIGRQAPARRAPVAPGPESTAALVQEVARVLRKHGLPERSSTEIVRALVTRGSVDRSDVVDDRITLTEAAWSQLLEDLSMTKAARR